MPCEFHAISMVEAHMDEIWECERDLAHPDIGRAAVVDEPACKIDNCQRSFKVWHVS